MLQLPDLEQMVFLCVLSSCPPPDCQSDYWQSRGGQLLSAKGNTPCFIPDPHNNQTLFIIVDTDECIVSICINANCFNSIGSFTCTCMEGFAFQNGSKTECVNVNECEGGLDNCGDICTDTEGSFVCSCLDGYVLDNDGHSCSPAPPTGMSPILLFLY